MSYKLRPRQEEAVEKIVDFITNSKSNHGIFVYPTGFGKSLIISTLAQKFPDRYFINVTSSKELVAQNYEKYISYGFEASICSASLNSKNVSHVTFATIGTLVKFSEFFKDKKVVIVYDEAHTASTKGSQIDNFLKQLKDYILVGVTATPFRLANSMNGAILKMMNRDRDCIYKSINDVVQISEVVEQGYWSKLVYDIKDVDETSLELNTTGSDYTDKSIEKFKEVNNINNRVIDEINNLISEGRKSILVSVPFISDAVEISNKIKGSKALFSGMNSNERDEIIKDFKSLRLNVIIQVKILTIGFDHPQLDAIVMAKPSNSLTFFYQLCIDKETEVLTKNGFKTFNQITYNDILYGYDMITGEVKENKLLNIINRPQYDFEKIMSFSNNRIDFRVSSEHDMIFKSRTKNYKKLPAREMLEHKTQMYVPVSGIEKSKGSNLEDKYLEFLGWFLSDGHHNKKNNRITISQSSTSTYINELRELLIKCNFSFKEYNIKRIKEEYAHGINFIIPKKSKDVNKTGWDILEKYIDKKLNSHYEDFTKQELSILLKGLIKGDGCNKGKYEWKVSSHLICTGIDEEFTDNLQSLLVRRGFYCKKTKKESTYNEIFNKNPKHYFLLTIKDTEYVSIPGYNDKDGSISNKKPYKRSRIIVEKTTNENLWCVETEMGSIITRRKGKVMIMGNCGRGVRTHQNKKDCKIVDLSGNCTKFGNVETITIENEKITKGWAVFNNDMLLSNYPLNAKIRPTKKSLEQKLKWDIDSKKDDLSDLQFYFGKYKDKKVSEVMKENKSYLTWLLDQKDFNWYGEKGTKLKECIEKHLGVFVEKYKVSNIQVSNTNIKDILQNHTSSLKNIVDLKDLW